MICAVNIVQLNLILIFSLRDSVTAMEVLLCIIIHSQQNIFKSKIWSFVNFELTSNNPMQQNNAIIRSMSIKEN